MILAPSASSVASAGLASDNVEYVGTIPLEAGTWSTARIRDDYLYVSGSKSFSIYDITDPVSPVLVSHTLTGFQFVNEDIDTNGEILLLSDERGQKRFMVYDVSDKRNPVKLAELTNIVDHNYACVLECTWAYGAGGNIVDLRDPANPKAVGKWFDPPPGLWGFDTTEVRPGVVLTASKIMHLLDGRGDPANPRVRAVAAAPRENQIIHSIQWPQGGKDRFVLVQSESSPKPRCDELSGGIMTWDATKWEKTRSFQMIDEFLLPAGTYVDGKPAASSLGCSAGWFKPHPKFEDGGLIVSAWFDHGTRFLEVSAGGRIEEVGYYMPYGGSTTAALWATEDIVYAIDVAHGIDILRFDQDAPPVP